MSLLSRVDREIDLEAQHIPPTIERNGLGVADIPPKITKDIGYPQTNKDVGYCI